MPDLVQEKINQLTEIIDSFEEREKSLKEDTAKMVGEKVETVEKNLSETVTALKQELKDYEEKIKKNNVSLSGLDESPEFELFSFAKTIRGIGTNNWKGADLEKKIIDEATAKAVDTNTGAQGGFVIPVELMMAKIIEPALANTVLEEAGTTFWKGLTADVDIPEATSRPILSWASDGAEATENDISFALQPLRPKEGNMIVKVSNRLLMQQPAAEPAVRKLMIEGVDDGLDEICLNGLGTESEPLGVFNVSGTNTTNLSSTRMTFDDVAGMQTDIMEQNFLKKGGGALITRPKVIMGMARQTVKQYSGQASDDAMPILIPITGMDAVNKMTGVKALGTTNVAVSSNITKAIVGDFKEFIVGIWGGARLKTSDVAGTAFTKNQTWLAIFVDVDSRATRPLAFDIASNVSTNF